MLLKSCRVKYPVDKSDKQFIVNDDNGTFECLGSSWVCVYLPPMNPQHTSSFHFPPSHFPSSFLFSLLPTFSPHSSLSLLHGLGNHVKFTGKSAPVAQEWVEKIRLVISEEEERERREVRGCVATG